MGLLGDIGNADLQAKLAHAAAECKRLGKPSGIVGAESRTWSQRFVGLRLFVGRHRLRHEHDGRARAGMARQAARLGGAGAEGARTVLTSMPKASAEPTHKASRPRGPASAGRFPMIRLAAGDATVELAPVDRRRDRVVHATGAATCCGRRPGRCARGSRRPPASRVLSARPVFEPHRGCDAPVRRPRPRRSRATSAIRRMRFTASAGSGRGRSSRRRRRPRSSRSTHDAAATTPRAWPWPFRATQTFALAAMRTGATLIAAPHDRERRRAAFPFGLGWHPFFPEATRHDARVRARRTSGATTRRSCRSRASPSRTAWRFARRATASATSRSTTCSRRPRRRDDRVARGRSSP